MNAWRHIIVYLPSLWQLSRPVLFSLIALHRPDVLVRVLLSGACFGSCYLRLLSLSLPLSHLCVLWMWVTLAGWQRWLQPTKAFLIQIKSPPPHWCLSYACQPASQPSLTCCLWPFLSCCCWVPLLHAAGSVFWRNCQRKYGFVVWLCILIEIRFTAELQQA